MVRFDRGGGLPCQRGRQESRRGSATANGQHQPSTPIHLLNGVPMADEEEGHIQHDLADPLTLREEFVLLIRTLTIHRAGCSSLRPLATSVGETPRSDAEVVRSTSLAKLEYALLQIEGAVHTCPRCRPGSDPVGLTMLTAYAANMQDRVISRRTSPHAPGAR